MKKYLPIILLSLVSIAAHIAWKEYTGYTAEDAYITFGFSKRIAEGYGFVYNIGHPIYGTTTPLFTLLMSLWMLVSSDPVLGATLYGLSAFIGGLWFFYFSLNRWDDIFVILPLALCLPLVPENMSGMETPFLFLFMSGTWWAYHQKRSLLAGIFCGLLLWIRIDALVFVLLMFTLYANKPSVGRFVLGGMIYLPWLIFAHFYFGSVIPYTLTAKMVAYGTGTDNIVIQFGRLLEYFTLPFLLSICMAIIFIPRKYIPLAVFFVVEIAFLSYSGSTFFTRYFYMLVVSGCLLIGATLTTLRKTQWRVMALFALLLITFRWDGQVEYYKFLQSERHVYLKEIGLWLHKNTPVFSTLQLEPLGYMGFYADRTIYDEVGLITPEVVELKKQHIGAEYYYSYLHADYVILQCGQANGVMESFEAEYNLIKKFTKGTARACYEVWGRHDV